LHTGLLAIAAVTLVSLIVAYPGQAFAASLAGLKIWWDFVFPALLPFFILSELLLGFGVVHALGALMGPAMRFLFRLPGAGGWAVAMSFAAGFPSGAKATADLRRNGIVGRAEGDRLLALSHLASPIFLSSVVAAGFLGRPELGLPLAFIHLLSALVVGVAFGRLSAVAGERTAVPSPRSSLVSVMADAHRQDGRPLGRLLGDAVASAVQSLLVLGGFMIVFSVLAQLVSMLGLRFGLEWLWPALLHADAPAGLVDGSLAALFEAHLGAYAVAHGAAPSVATAALLSAVIGWGGLSVHAQVKSLIGGTDLRYAPFLLARFAHAIVAALLALALWNPMLRWLGVATEAFAGSNGGAASAPLGVLGRALPHYVESAQALGVFLLAALLLSGALRLFRRGAAAR
jgi:sporulation integral membrane protein YlbJ